MIVSAILAALLLILKLLAVTWGSRYLVRLCPDRLAAWLSAWIIFQAGLLVIMLALSLVYALNALTIWFVVSGAAAGAYVGSRGVEPIGVSRAMLQSGVAPYCFAIVFAALALRASIFLDFTRDGESYGLVRNALWMNYQSLLVHMQSPQSAVFTYEWNSDLLACAYGLASGNLQGLMFGSVEIFLVCYLGCSWLAFRFGAATSWAALAGLVCVLTPAALGLFGVLKGDLLACAALVIAVGWLTVIPATTQPLALAMLPASSALALGSKLTTLPAIAVVGAAALVLAVRRQWRLADILWLAAGVILSCVFLARYGLNALHFGSAMQHGERVGTGVETVLENFDPFILQLMQFGTYSIGGFKNSKILSGGLGLAGLFAVVLVVVQWAKAVTPTRGRIVAIVGAAVVITSMASLIPYQPWAFRYYLPVVFVALLAIISIPRGTVSRWLDAALTLVGLVVAGCGVEWYTHGGEPWGNRSMAAGISATLHSSDIVRGALAGPELVANYTIPGHDFDQAKALRFAVLQQVDAPISPLLGARAQNRLVFAHDPEGLLRLAKTHEDIHYVVFTKPDSAPIAPDIKAKFEASGFVWLQEGQFAAIAGRSPKEQAGRPARGS